MKYKLYITSFQKLVSGIKLKISHFFLSLWMNQSKIIKPVLNSNLICIFFLIINNNKYKLYICIPSKVREQNWEFLTSQVPYATITLSKIIGPCRIKFELNLCIHEIHVHPYIKFELNVCNDYWDNDGKVNFSFFSKFKRHN